MREYETTFIVQPEISDEGVEALTGRLDKILESHESIRLMYDDQGRRRLAYEIQNFQKGRYIALQYLDAGTAVAELERALRLDDSILRFLTVQVSKEVKDVAGRKAEAAEIERVRAEKAAERAQREIEEAERTAQQAQERAAEQKAAEQKAAEEKAAEEKAAEEAAALPPADVAEGDEPVAEATGAEAAAAEPAAAEASAEVPSEPPPAETAVAEDPGDKAAEEKKGA